MDEKERIAKVFAEANIDGMDLYEGMARFGNNSKLYLKVIKTFADNIGHHLDTLATLSEDTLPDYAIEVHGVKGSCYGINANREGKMAEALEIAAKAGNYAEVEAGNGPLIDEINALVPKLNGLLDACSGDGGTKKPEPDRALLRDMLIAAREFDVDKMQKTLEELEKFEYEKDGDLVKWLSDQVTMFAYDLIQQRLEEIL